MAYATVVTLVPLRPLMRGAGSETMGYVPRVGLRPPRVFRQRRRVAVLTQQGWSQDPGPEEGGGLAGVREPRRPTPVPPSLMAALPLPEDETAS
jgi:hypothetical protein